MTLDAQALIAIVCQQPGWQDLVAQAMRADHPRVPATALAEAGMVLTSRDNVVSAMALYDVVRALGLTVVPFTERDWFEAVREYHRRLHAADAPRPRFGDCMTTVVAARTGSPVVTTPAGSRQGN